MADGFAAAAEESLIVVELSSITIPMIAVASPNRLAAIETLFESFEIATDSNLSTSWTADLAESIPLGTVSPPATVSRVGGVASLLSEGDLIVS